VEGVFSLGALQRLPKAYAEISEELVCIATKSLRITARWEVEKHSSDVVALTALSDISI
jgi:hypothetical protein